MITKKRLASLCIMMVTLSLSACGHVAIKDFEICSDIGEQGATCDYFLPPAEPHDFEKNEWDDKRFGQFCISSDAFGDIKRELEELCSTHQVTCDYETRKAMRDFFAKIERMKKRI